MKPLYELVAQYRELQTLDAEEVDDQTFADTLEALGGEITEKATNVALYYRNLDSFADQVEETAKKLSERAARIRRRGEWLRAYLLNQLRGAGISQIKAPEFTISIRKNLAAVIIGAGAQVPAEFMVQPEPTPPRPDKKLIKEALQAGRVVEGCWLEQGERLEIKV